MNFETLLSKKCGWLVDYSIVPDLRILKIDPC
jgi:hypothetical protein